MGHCCFCLSSRYTRLSGGLRVIMTELQAVSHSNVPISSESHYTMVCLLTINFPNKLLFGDIRYLCWKTLLSPPSLPPYPTSFLSSSTSSSSPPPASTAHVVSLFASSFPLCPSPSFPFLLPTDITILSAAPGPRRSFSGQWVFCSLNCFLPCSHLFLACLQKMGMGECKGCGQLILKEQMNSARSRRVGRLNTRSLNKVHVLASCVLKAPLLASCV